MLQLGHQFEFTVEQIRSPLPAELNQAFFDKGLGKGVAKSTAALQEQLIYHKQQEADRFLERAIQAALLKHTKINLPDDFLKSWLQKKE